MYENFGEITWLVRSRNPPHPAPKPKLDCCLRVQWSIRFPIRQGNIWRESGQGQKNLSRCNTATCMELAVRARPARVTRVRMCVHTAHGFAPAETDGREKAEMCARESCRCARHACTARLRPRGVSRGGVLGTAVPVAALRAGAPREMGARRAICVRGCCLCLCTSHTFRPSRCFLRFSGLPHLFLPPKTL